MKANEKTLVVIDPAEEVHIALDRALITSRLRTQRPDIHIFIGVDVAVKNASGKHGILTRDTTWFETLIQPLRDEGLTVTTEVCLSGDWQHAVLQSAEREQADVIVVPDYSTVSKNLILSDAKWALLRHASCPVLIVRPGADAKRKTVLAAINFGAQDARYESLNDKILDSGQWMAGRYGADLHVVNAYEDSLHYPDRGQLARKLGLASDHIHVKQGNPEAVIDDTAKELGADVVVIGTLSREGILAAMRGNTSEKVLGLLSQDVLTLN